MNSKEMMDIVVNALDEKKGEDIVTINISEISTVADYMVIVTGLSNPQIKALTDNVEFRLGEKGIHPKAIEGNKKSTWILMDYNDVIVHIFSKEDREFYNLEKNWKDADITEVQQ